MFLIHVFILDGLMLIYSSPGYEMAKSNTWMESGVNIKENNG